MNWRISTCSRSGRTTRDALFQDLTPGRAGGRDRVDHPAARAWLGSHGRGGRVEVGGHPGILARQIGADHGPVLPPVLGAEEPLVREVERARIALREDERQRPGGPVGAGVGERGIHRPRLQRAQVELLDGAAVDDIRIARVGGDVVALAPRRDLPEMGEVDPVEAGGAAGDRGRPRVLLRAVDPVWKTVVGGDPI